MAYDHHDTYVPPKRQNYGNFEQQAPAQNYQERQYDDYRGHQGYDQGYDQGYGNGYQNDSQPPMTQYNGSSLGQQQYAYSASQPAPAPYTTPNDYSGPQDRAYDQRYQQRDPVPGYNQNNARPQYSPERKAVPQSNRQYRHGDGVRDDPRHVPRSRIPPNQSYGADYESREHHTRSRGGDRSMQSQDYEHRGNARGASMDDWKAREKMKMNDSARAPHAAVQDNAFPAFSNGKPKPGRSSHDGAKPSTSSNASNRDQVPATQLQTSRENGYSRHNHGYGVSNTRPSIDQNSVSSPLSPRGPYNEGPSVYNPTNTAYGGSHYDGRPDFSNGTSSQSGPPPSQYDSRSMDFGPRHPAADGSQYGRRPSVPNSASNHAYDYATEISHPGNGPPQHAQRLPSGRQDFHPSNQRSGSIDSRETGPSYAQAMYPPVHVGHSSSSPPKMMQSPNAYPNAPNQTHEQRHASEDLLPPPTHPSNRSSLGDFYDQYHAHSPVHANSVPAQSREQQIESEMPNFDNVASSPTSPSQQRGLQAQALPGLPHSSTQSLPNSQSRSYQTDVPRDGSSGPSPRYQSPMSGPRPAPTTSLNGQATMNFSVPSSAYKQQSLDQSQRPPLASNSSSVDDPRQMPIRSAPLGGPSGPPQPQRFYSHGPSPSPNGPLPTLGSQEPRVGSAPPVQGNMHGPPNTVPMSMASDRQQAPAQHPDALPHHPIPVRPGLDAQQKSSQSERPPPVRNYDSVSSNRPGSGRPTNHPPDPNADRRVRASVEVAPPQLTHADIERLRGVVNGNPNNPKQALALAKMLVEASRVLSDEGGRADAKTAAKNREKYINEAYKRVKKLVSGGYPEAQFYLADCYGSGELGLDVDSREAFNLYQTAAKQGHPQAAYRTAVCCEIGAEDGGGTRKDYSKAVQWYRRASALGDVAAMYKLGIIQLRGMLSEPRNVGEALNWLKRSADRADADHPHALHELATLYESSNRDPEVRSKLVADDTRAHELYHQAAKFDFKTSQFRLGQAYEYGQLGLSIDNRASIAWYSKAAAQGEHQAELALSGWYLTGADGILEQSDTEAYLWARKAASSEPPQPKAMFAMGYFSEQGIGCPASVDEARRWYGRAASYKFPKALERLEELKRNSKGKVPPVNGKINRKDQKKNESECVVM